MIYVINKFLLCLKSKSKYSYRARVNILIGVFNFMELYYNIKPCLLSVIKLLWSFFFVYVTYFINVHISIQWKENCIKFPMQIKQFYTSKEKKLQY